MVGIIAAIGSLLLQLLNSSVAKWIAEKALWTFFIIIVLPIILNNWAYDLLEIGINLVSDNVQTASINGSTNWTGLSAYFLHHLAIPDSLTVVMGAIAVKVYMRLASPFIRW